MSESLEKAKIALSGHTIALCRDGKILTHDGRGISPMLDFLGRSVDLSGYCVADEIVGRAVAMLFHLSGIREVYARVMSKSAKEYLDLHGIPNEADLLVDTIRNRQNTGMCPMEETVKDISDPAVAYEALKLKALQLKSQPHTEH